MRRAARKDANHGVIQKAYEEQYCSVVDTSKLGDDFPDLVVGLCGRTFLVEVKNRKGRNKVEPGQKKFHDEWRGEPPIVVHSVDEVVAHVQRVRAEG